MLFLFLVKIVAVYTLLVCKIVGRKIWLCRFFDKSQVWSIQCNTIEAQSSSFDWELCGFTTGKLPPAHGFLRVCQSLNQIHRAASTEQEKPQQKALWPAQPAAKYCILMDFIFWSFLHKQIRMIASPFIYISIYGFKLNNMDQWPGTV